MADDIERMDDFFNKRSAGYDNHMQENVSNYNEFYPKIAEDINNTQQAIKILDIGCGTGIELEYVFQKAPNAEITCLDLSQEMLDKLKEKYQDKNKQITTLVDSYLNNNFTNNSFDYILSVMTVHHLKYAKKLQLYKNIYNALSAGGKYIEGDYIVSPSKEKKLLQEYEEKTANLTDADMGKYHIDIPFSLKTQKELFKKAGFKEFNLIYQKDEAAIYSIKK